MKRRALALPLLSAAALASAFFSIDCGDNGSSAASDGGSTGDATTVPGTDDAGGGADATSPGDGNGDDAGGGGTDGGSGDDGGTPPPPPDAGNDADAGPPASTSVLQFHNHATRDGVFIDPGLTAANAAKMHLDVTFKPTIAGNVYAQPLYLDAADGIGGKEALFVVTETNNVYALDSTGATIWTQNVGQAASGAENCGNILPLGITGTPVIDLPHRALYLDAARPSSAPDAATTLAEHEIHALSLDTGKELTGWPVRASTVKAANNTLAFNPKPQSERGALLVVGNTLYVGYGGHAGDCGDKAGEMYRGWVVGVPLDKPSAASGYATDAPGAGIWAVGGLASDGTDLFLATGNSYPDQNCPNPPPTSPPPGWAQQEALLRLQPGPVWSGKTTDYFVPDDWPCLDNADLDLGGSNPVLFDIPGATPAHYVMGLGKDGREYLVNRDSFGGAGGALASKLIYGGVISMGAAAYTTAKGTYVVSYGAGAATGCPTGQSGTMASVKVTPGTPPTLSVAWCVNPNGSGSPIFTTSDGTNDPLVWNLGAEGTNRLYAWNADTGAAVFAGGTTTDVVAGAHHFSTIIAAHGRIFVGANNNLYAFTSAP